MIRLSCADYTFPTLQRMQALRMLRLLEFDFVDIGLFARSDHYSPARLAQLGNAYTRQVNSELNDAELRIGDVFLQAGVEPFEYSVNDPSKSIRIASRAIFNRALEFCTALGVHHLTGLPGVFHEESTPAQDLELASAEAAWRVDQCANAGIRYSVEPHIGSICPDIEATLALLKNVSGLTLTLDYGHFIHSGHTSDKVHALLPMASHIHTRGAAPGKLQTSVLENTIDFSGMLKQLAHLSYRGLLALEYVWVDWEGCNRTDNVAETVRLRDVLEITMQQIDKEKGTSCLS